MRIIIIGAGEVGAELAAGTNFTLYYYVYNRRWSLLRDDRELRFYLACWR